MKGVTNTFNASDFQANDGGPGFYTPFDDSGYGWTQARAFINWMGHRYPSNYAGFNDANRLARRRPDEFKAWITLQRLRGE